MTLPRLPAFLSLVTAVLVLSLAAAQADGTRGIDTSKLVIFDEEHGIAYEDWVSVDPLETHRVKKIEGGRVNYVTIARTATGTYSSDGLASRHVQYPGIIETPKSLNNFRFSVWDNGSWTTIRSGSGNSFISISSYRTRDGQLRTSTCLSSASHYYC